MKYLFILLLSIGFAAHATNTTIEFSKAGYSEIFKIAKKENKAVMLFFHFDGCPPCAKMQKETFINSEVAGFYNSHFINFEIITTTEEGKKLSEKYNVKLKPTVVYTDAAGNELGRIIGFYEPAGFITQAQKALSPNQSLVYFKNEYAKGNRNPDFLYEYTYKLKETDQLDTALVNEYLNTQNTEELASKKNITYMYEFALVNFTPVITFNSRVFNFMLNNTDKFAAYFEPGQTEVRLVWIALEKADEIINSQDETDFKILTGVLKKFNYLPDFNYKEIDGSVSGFMANDDYYLFTEIEFYQKGNNFKKYDTALREYLNKNANNASALNNIAWNFYENYNDPENLKKALAWSEKSVELEDIYYTNDTCAHLHYKLGNKTEAKKHALKAIALAKTEGVDHEETEVLLDTITNSK